MSSISLPLACGFGGPELALLLLAIPIAGAGLLFFCYWPYKAAIAGLAKGSLMGRPMALFCAAMLGGLAWCACFCAAIVFLLKIPPGGGVFLLVALSLAGGIGWAVMLFAWLFGRKQPMPAMFPQTPKPKLQIWAQDLVVALLCYGTGLSILNLIFEGKDQSHMDTFLSWAFYLLVAGTIGLLISADVCRRSASGQEPVKRGAIFVMVFTLFPLTLPFALIAWQRWRKGLA